MSAWLSKNEINSFVGDVLPIKLLSNGDISKSNIYWSVSDSQILGIRTFAGDDPQSISDGALVTLKRAGTAEISAEYNGKKHVCRVSVREMKSADKNSKLNYYIGDLHDHMANTHDHEKFAKRETQLSIDYVRELKEKSDIDFAVISDHACVTNPRDFFKGFVDVESELPMKTVIFAGSESEITVVEEDRFGIKYKKSGEIVCINSDNFINTDSWEKFYNAMSSSPFGVGIFAHPYIVGYSVPGIWNFEPHKRTYEPFRRFMKGVEMGNGTIRESQILYETFYSQALDCGFRVAPVCSSDAHNSPRGYDAFPGKTVIMAEEGSREAFLDALFNCRFYATESGNVKLYYTVNGMPAASTIESSQVYNFHIEISYFKEDKTTAPKKIEVISNYGEVIESIECNSADIYDFSVSHSEASYFYLRLVDSLGRKTWSAPVWTEKNLEIENTAVLMPIDKTAFSATEIESGENAEALICENPLLVWKSKLSSAGYIIDMKKPHNVSAISHYTPYVRHQDLAEEGVSEPFYVSCFVSKYKVSVSLDGKSWREVKKGKIRLYSGEEYICFEKQNARYIKFDVESTAGKESEWPEFEKSPIIIGEISIFEAK